MSILFPQRDRRDKYLIGAAAYHHDPLLYIERQVKHIQRHLQILIDAQSEGLLAGLTGSRQDDVLSNDSPARTSSDLSSSRGPSTVPVRQPGKRKIGLRAAREGILKFIYDLLKLREEERGIIRVQIDARKDALMEIDQFSSKRAGLEESISAIRNDPDGEHSRKLREEARNLEADIKELENRLYEMKARHRHVLDEISQIENSVEAKLSSYKASLSLVESGIRKYLQNPPLEPLASTAKDATFYSLDPKRRTLGMAQEHWKNEQTQLGNRQREVDMEIGALEEGGDVWKQVVAEISGFEKRLKAEMRRFIQTQSQLLQPDESVANKPKGEQVKGILEDLENTTRFVARKLDLAEEKDWRLLVCCIGAELEALNEARDMLFSAFDVSEEEDQPAPEREPIDEGPKDERGESHTDPHDVDNPEPPADLLKDADSHSHDPVFRSEDDEEPDPAWLLPET